MATQSTVPVPPAYAVMPATAPAPKSRKWIFIGCGCFIVLAILVVVAFVVGSPLLALFGISSAQLNSRETERRSALQDINAAISSYYATTSTYPAMSDIILSPSSFVIGHLTPSSYMATLKDAAMAIPGTQSTDTGTVYCFALEPDGYKLGAKSEKDQSWFDAGTSAQKCTDADILQPGASGTPTPSGTTDSQVLLRDTQRQSKLLDMKVAVTEFYSQTAHFPKYTGAGTTDEFHLEGNMLSLDSEKGPNITTVELLNAVQAIEGTVSTPLGTVYCYAVVPDGYILGAKSEKDGSWLNVGTSTGVKCTDANIVQLFVANPTEP